MGGLQMKLLLLPLTAFMLPACGILETDDAPQPFGERHLTPLGIPFWWWQPSASYETPDAAASGIDEAFGWWVPLQPGWSYDALLAVARDHEIQLYPGDKVPGNKPSRNYAGFTWDSGLIEIAMDRFWTDPDMNLDHVGMLTLRHEWRHALLGNWH
jgi:hypothetical protein